MVRVIWTESAQQDLDELFRYNDALSHKMAITCSEEFIKAGDRLMQTPEMGQKEPALIHLKRNYRYILVKRKYKLIYLYENGTCSLLMIWDCRKNPKSLKSDERFHDNS